MGSLMRLKTELDDAYPTGIAFKHMLINYPQKFQLFIQKWDNLIHMNNNDYFVQNEIFTHIVWIKLNSGTWCDVADFYRILYSILCIHYVKISIKFLTVIDNKKLVELIGKIDDALVMGKPVFNNIGGRIAHIIHKYIDISPHNRSTHEVFFYPKKPVLNNLLSGKESIIDLSSFITPSFQEFQSILRKGEPFIIKQSIKHWPALKRWTLTYWYENFGCRKVPVELGSSYIADSWSQSIMPMSQFINEYVFNDSAEIGYLAQHQLFLQIPELLNDIDIPEYCYVTSKNHDTEVDMNIWFGPKGTTSPLHNDGAKHNLLCQVRGCKYVKLYTSDQTPYLYAHEERLLSNTSKVNVTDPDFNEFPLFVKAKGYHGYIDDGDMLYIPPKCWHYVESMSTSFSVNFWWKTSDD